MKVLALEPYYGGSHKAFLDGWQKHSRHEFTVLGLPFGFAGHGTIGKFAKLRICTPSDQLKHSHSKSLYHPAELKLQNQRPRFPSKGKNNCGYQRLYIG